MLLPAQPNQSLIDGLTILQTVASCPEPIGSRELARQLGIESTRANRLLKTLAHLGLAKQDKQRKYSAGPGIHVLASQVLFGSRIIRRAVPYLEALHSYKLIVAMGVLWRDKVSYLYHGQPGMSASDALGRAGLFPARKSAIGIALLAENCDLRHCDNTLKALIKETRDKKYSLVYQDNTSSKDNSDANYIVTNSGAISLGVAVPDDSAVAIALSGIINKKDIPNLAKILQHTAQQIAESS